jgi:hypothetical protein
MAGRFVPYAHYDDHARVGWAKARSAVPTRDGAWNKNHSQFDGLCRITFAERSATLHVGTALRAFAHPTSYAASLSVAWTCAAISNERTRAA